MPISSKTYCSDLNSISNYMRTPHRTNLEFWLTVKKSIISPILSSTLLQIYCIGLIGPISTFYLFWVWAVICDLTIYIYIYIYIFFFGTWVPCEVLEFMNSSSTWIFSWNSSTSHGIRVLEFLFLFYFSISYNSIVQKSSFKTGAFS